MLLVILVTGCTSLCFNPKHNDNQELIGDLEDKISSLERQTPSEFLVKCKNLSPIENNTVNALDEAVFDLYKKYKECKRINNSRVDYELELKSNTGTE